MLFILLVIPAKPSLRVIRRTEVFFFGVIFGNYQIIKNIFTFVRYRFGKIVVVVVSEPKYRIEIKDDVEKQ